MFKKTPQSSLKNASENYMMNRIEVRKYEGIAYSFWHHPILLQTLLKILNLKNPGHCENFNVCNRHYLELSHQRTIFNICYFLLDTTHLIHYTKLGKFEKKR